MTARLSWTFERSLTRFLDLPQVIGLLFWKPRSGRMSGVRRFYPAGAMTRFGFDYSLLFCLLRHVPGR